MDSIVGNQYDGCTCTYCGQQLVLDLHYRVVLLSVQVNNGEVIVWFYEVVVCDAFNQLPCTHGQYIVRVANISQLQVSCCIDVQEDVAHIVFAVRINVMVYELRVFRRHVGIGEDKFRTFCLVEAHGEEASLCILAFLADAIVINLLVGKLEVINSTTISNAFGNNLLELYKMSSLGSQEQVSSRWNGNAVHYTHGSFSINRGVEGNCTCVGSGEITLCRTGLRRNYVQVVSVAAEHQEHLLTRGVLAHSRIDNSAFLRCHLQVESVVGAIDPIAVLNGNLW